jgi:hypothetical protein
LTTLLFAERPSSPPSYSALLRILDQERNLTASRLVRHQIDHARSMERQRKLAGLKQRRNMLRQQSAAAAAGAQAMPLTEFKSSSNLESEPAVKSEPMLEPSPLSAASYTSLDDNGTSASSLLSPRVYSGAESLSSSSALTSPFSSSSAYAPSSSAIDGRKQRSNSFTKPSSFKKVQTKSTEEALADIQAAILEVYEDEDDVDEDAVIGDQSQSWRSLLALFKEPGFIHTVVAFAFTESTLNVYSTFMTDLLSGGFSTSYVSWMGTFFVVANLVGSQIVSTLVDKHKTYKKMMMICFMYENCFTLHF